MAVKPKIISLTPAEAGHNTVKQREYHPARYSLNRIVYSGPSRGSKRVMEASGTIPPLSFRT